MANVKISNLPAADALDGTEKVPVVQGSSTKRATVADILASIPNGTFVQVAGTQVATGTSKTLMAAPVQTHADFQWKIDNNPVTGNGQTFNDPVMKFGWNINRSSDATKAGLHLAFEQDFWTNIGFDGAWHHQSEAHIECMYPDGTISRLFTAGMNWTLKKADTHVVGDWFSIDTTAGGQMLTTAPGNPWYTDRGFQIGGTSPGVTVGDGSANPHLGMNGPPAGHSELQFQDSGVGGYWIIEGRSDASHALWFHDALNGRYNLILNQGADALTGNVELRSILKVNDSTLWQTTVGAAGGASAMPATPTKYLKVQDNAGGTYVVAAFAVA